MNPLVLQTRDQRELYAALVDPRGDWQRGRACVVLDPTWPREPRARAVTEVTAAWETGWIQPGDLVVFSSGSAGRPRGVVRTLESWQASLSALTSLTGLTKDDVVWLPGPLWSSIYLYGAFHAAAVGAEVVLAEEDPAAATVVHCVPTALVGLVERGERGAQPAPRLVVVAGDRLSDSLRARAARLGWRVLEYYGSTELSFVGWADDVGPMRAFPGARTKVADGQIWVRSPYLARGYLSPEVHDPFRREGSWASVGDLGRTLPGGFLVAGRGDAAVTVGGHTVVVEDVEAVLRAVPGVSDAAVVGIPHPRLGARLVAAVVGDVTNEALRDAVAALPSPSRPRRFVRLVELPRGASGKVQRDELRSRLPQVRSAPA